MVKVFLLVATLINLYHASSIGGLSRAEPTSQRGNYLVDFESLNGKEWIIRFEINRNEIERLRQATIHIDSKQLQQYTDINENLTDVGIQFALQENGQWYQIQFSRKINQILNTNRPTSEIVITNNEIREIRSNIMDQVHEAYYQDGLDSLGRWSNRWDKIIQPYLELLLDSNIHPTHHITKRASNFRDIPQPCGEKVYPYIIEGHFLSNPVNIGSCAPPNSFQNPNCKNSAYRDEASKMCEISHNSFEIFSYAYMRAHAPSNHHVTGMLSCVPIEVEYVEAIGYSSSGQAQKIQIEKVSKCGCR